MKTCNHGHSGLRSAARLCWFQRSMRPKSTLSSLLMSYSRAGEPKLRASAEKWGYAGRQSSPVSSLQLEHPNSATHASKRLQLGLIQHIQCRHCAPGLYTKGRAGEWSQVLRFRVIFTRSVSAWISPNSLLIVSIFICAALPSLCTSWPCVCRALGWQ